MRGPLLGSWRVNGRLTGLPIHVTAEPVALQSASARSCSFVPRYPPTPPAPVPAAFVESLLWWHSALSSFRSVRDTAGRGTVDQVPVVMVLAQPTAHERAHSQDL